MTTPNPQTPAVDPAKPAVDPAAPVAAAAPAADPAKPAVAADPAKPAVKSGAPEKYEPFTLPDGVKFSPELQTGIEGFARKAGLSQEVAQELAGFAAAQLQQLDALAANQRQAWLEAAQKDPEIGGDKLTPAVTAAADVIAAFAGQDATEFKQYLDKTGLGNHPVYIKVMARVRAAISEDKFVPAGGKQPTASDARSLYPNSNMNP